MAKNAKKQMEISLAVENENATAKVASTKMHEYREHLKEITNGLMDLAKQAGRTDYTRNQLLRECYNLVDVELNTFEGWKEKGAQVRKGQHAYLFWGAPIEKGEQRFFPVRFLFAKEQVRFAEVQA